MYCMLFLDLRRVLLMWLFFFFKQKTAYEMRISDWSSDVCSSDLPIATSATCNSCIDRIVASRAVMPGFSSISRSTFSTTTIASSTSRPIARTSPNRSEEQPSELQSLMRISYAVFCLKKKTIHDIHHDHTTSYNQRKRTTKK